MKHVGAGTHTVLDLYWVDLDSMTIINNCEESKNIWNEFMQRWFATANITCINTVWHDFDRAGAFTALYLLSESHLSIHTWPEKRYIAIDIFTCGDCDMDYMVSQLVEYFAPKYKTETKLVRGEMLIDNNT
jgi:S-adenosylmethionine decarboxylase proenzyme